MRLTTILLLATIFFSTACKTTGKAKGSTDEWMNLFNGKDLKDWMVKIHHHEEGDNYANTFRVEEDMIQIRYDGYGQFNERYGHLYYKEPFSAYHLKFEYRFQDSTTWLQDAPSYTLLNSGVMFHSQDPRTMPKEQDWPISVEMQLLAGLPSGGVRTTGNMCSPGTHVVYKNVFTNQHCINSSSRTYPAGEWVNGELIVIRDSIVKHIINGDTVLQYSHPQIGGEVVNRYDPAEKRDGKMLTSGYIALQSEGQPVDFRNIRLKRLD